jgi:hypothetical protein
MIKMVEDVVNKILGNYCGTASGFENYPYLYFPKLSPTGLTSKICVASCPQETGDIDCKKIADWENCGADETRYNSKLCMMKILIPSRSIKILPSY